MGTKPEQNPDDYCRLRERVYELLTSPGTEVTNIIFPNDDVAWVSWKYSEENVAAGKNVNVGVAAYVNTQVRLKLYEYLSKLGQSLLYCDTDSVVFLKKDNDPQKVKKKNNSFKRTDCSD